jgi:RNA polymerase sigma-70 factor (ECF subfamily)
MKINENCDLSFAKLCKLSDEALMAELKSGHDDALAVLFDRYHRLVLSIAIRILRDPEESEDLMQAVFFEIYRVKAQFDPERGTTKAWIMQYTYHRSLNRLRYLGFRGLTQNKRVEATEELIGTGSQNGNRWLNPPELARMVEQGLAALTLPQRTTIKLAFYEGLSMAEIATSIKQPVSNVRHHYYRGLRALRSLFFADGGWMSGKAKAGEKATATDVKS